MVRCWNKVQLVRRPPPLLDQCFNLANTQRPCRIENRSDPGQRFNLRFFAFGLAVHAAPESGIDRQPVTLISHVFGVIKEEWMQRNATIFTGTFLCKSHGVIMWNSPNGQLSPTIYLQRK